MNMLRKLGRAAVLLTGGRPAEASQAAVTPAAKEDPPTLPFRSEREEEDEFEGEGWSFWG